MDLSPMTIVFLTRISVEGPMLALVVAGAAVCWTKLARTHRDAFRWSVAGLAVLGLRSLLAAFGQARTATAVAEGTRPMDLAGEYVFWVLTDRVSLLIGVAFLLVAALASRSIRREE